MRTVTLAAAFAASTIGLTAQTKTPRGFRKFENKLAGLHFCYPLGWKQMPLKPTEKVLRAQYMLPRAPRELKEFRKRYKGREPHLFVFSFDKKELDEIAKAEERGKFSVAGFFANKGLMWEVEPVGGKKGHYTMQYAFSDGGTGMKRCGYMVAREEGTHVLGVFGTTWGPHLDEMTDLVITMAGTVTATAKPGLSAAARAELDALYEGKDWLDIPKRKKVRSRLAKGWKAVDTPNYILVYNSRSKLLVNRIAREIEAMRALYEQVLPAHEPVTAVSTVRLCKTFDDYYRYGGRPGSGGYFHPLHEELVLIDYHESMRKLTAKQRKQLPRRWSDADSVLVMYHEALHQYVFYAGGELFPHDWFNEGLGDYFSGAINPGVGGRVPRIGPSPLRINRAKDLNDTEHSIIPLAKILHAERAEFYGRRRGDYYALAWSFVYFLKESDVAKSHPRWSKLIGDYYESIKKAYADELHKERKKLGRKKGDELSLRERFVAAFKARKTAIEKTLDGIDLDALEKAWRAYVAEMDVPANMRRRR